MAFHRRDISETKTSRWLTAGDGTAMKTSTSNPSLSGSPSAMLDSNNSKSAQSLATYTRSSSTSPNFSVRLRQKKVNRNNPNGARPKSMGPLGFSSANHKVPSGSHNRMCLTEALQDKKLRLGLRMFLESEYSAENLDFWLEAEEYRKLKTHDDRQKCADAIYRAYIAIGSPNQINLDHFNRGNIQEELAAGGVPSRDLFVGAQKYIFNILENDSFARFTRSRHFAATQPPARRSPRELLRDLFPSRRKHVKPAAPDTV